MPEAPYIVTVARDLEDLIPVFLSNREKELATLQTAVSESDFAQLRHIGHRMKGVGTSYGFSEVSNLGKTIEDAAKVSDLAIIEATVQTYAAYLSRIEVVYE